MKYYSGVGSRETPADVLSLMREIAFKLGSDGWMLRSGGADGADEAFEEGAKPTGLYDIYLPWDGFNERKVDGEHYFLGFPADAEIAERLHPAWPRLSQGARKLHTRNIAQILGAILPGGERQAVSRMVICWTEGGKQVGGTAQAMRLADERGVPIFNLALEADRERVERFVQ